MLGSNTRLYDDQACHLATKTKSKDVNEMLQCVIIEGNPSTFNYHAAYQIS